MGQHQGNGNLEEIRKALADPTTREKLEKIAKGFLTRGWHNLEEVLEPGLPVRAFTFGLYPSFGHPEIVIIGYPHNITSHLLATACERVQAGESFQLEREYEGFLDGYKVAFKHVHPSHYDRFLPFLKGLYRTNNFPVIQVVIPDEGGRYPWDSGVQAQFRQVQRVLDKP